VQLKAGQRLRSQVCATEVIIVRAPAVDTDLRCGGSSMVDVSAPEQVAPEPASGFDTGNMLGKRYTSPDDEAFEVLVTKAGTGTLAAGETLLIIKTSKPLPSSD
jgi:hypothetical protein